MRALKFFGFIAVLIVLSVAAIYVAGALMLLTQHQSLSMVNYHTWYDYYFWYNDNLKMRKHIRASAFMAVVFCYFVPLIVVLNALKKKKALFGDARFSNQQEVRNSVLVKPSSSPRILVGKMGDMFLGLPGEQFVNLAAPTRSGKGVSTVIPNCLSYPDSMVVKDDKFENFNITSGVRKLYGHEVHLFAPLTEHRETSRFNVFGYVRKNEFRVADIIMIGEILYPSGRSKDPFWENSARNLFLANALYLSETPTRPFTLGEMMRLGSFKGKTPKAYFTDLIAERNSKKVQKINPETAQIIEVDEPITLEEWCKTNKQDRNPLPPLSPECLDSIYRFLSSPEQTMSSIVTTYLSPLLLWANPVVDAATQENDFDLDQIRKKRMTIYVGAPSEASLLINLFFSVLIKINLRSMPLDDPSIKNQCLLLLDELTSLGTINILDEANGYLASYWLRPLLIYQSQAQLEQDQPRGYGQTGARTLATNCAVNIAHAPREEKDAEAYSKMLGTMTVINETKTINARSKGGGGTSRNRSDHSRALLLPQEVKEIGTDKQIVFIENMKPILCQKIRYYEEKIFIDKLKEVSPSLAALGDALPTFDQLKMAVQNKELRVQPRILEIKEQHAMLAQESMAADSLETAIFAHMESFKAQNAALISKAMGQDDTNQSDEDPLYNDDGTWNGDGDESDAIEELESEESKSDESHGNNEISEIVDENSTESLDDDEAFYHNQAVHEF